MYLKGTEESRAAVQRFTEYTDRHREICVIDSVTHMEVCANRKVFLKELEGVLRAERGERRYGIRIPWSMEVACPNSDSAVESIEGRMAADRVGYPLMVKTQASVTLPTAHLMYVVMDREGLRTALGSYDEKLIVQEYVNHDATVYKVYIWDKREMVATRESSSNLTSQPDLHSVRFYTNQPWPEALRSAQPPLIRPLPSEAVTYLSNLIKHNFRISLFGFDVLRPTNSEDLVVIDLNYLPGYKELKELGGIMDELVMEKVEEYRGSRE